MEKIKILRIIARLNIGGPAIHTILLTAELDKNKFDSLLVYGKESKDEGNMLYYAQEKGIKAYLVPELTRELNLVNDLCAFFKILKLIQQEKPFIIHTHTAKAGTLGRSAGILYNFLHPFRKRKIKLVHTFHGHIFSGYFNKFTTNFFISIERILGFFSAEIITVSESVKKELLMYDIAGLNKIQVIPLGFELNKFLSIPLAQRTPSNIGIIGRLVPIKNHRLFLEAAAKVIHDDPEIKLKFKIIGDGELRSELEGYSAKLNITNHVIFMGWQKDLSAVYSDLDIVVLTSLNEGTPVSLIEAMASGRVVVATDVGGIRDLLGQTIKSEPNEDFETLERGLIIKSGDYFGLANAVKLLLHNPQLRKDLALKSRDFVKNNFTKERLIKDIENLYSAIK